MKQVVLFVTITCFAATACVVNKNRITYEFPAAMPQPVMAEYLKQCDKGKILYDINCARCHNVAVKGRTVIPDFSQEQLIGYELRVLNPKHESSMPETLVNAEELGLITTFLTYKKKTNVSLSAGHKK